MKNVSALALPFLVCFSAHTHAQLVEDTIVEYNLISNTKSFLIPSALPSSSTSAHTPFSFGTFQTAQNLPATAPLSNLIPNTVFTKLAKASGTFNVSSFPARTAVKVVHYKNGNSASMTGMLVGNCMVATAGHIVYASGANPVSDFTFDSIRVLPAFDNGAMPPGFSSATVEKMYVFKHYFNNLTGDIALLQLSRPLGEMYGFTGIGFEADETAITNKLYHKFSYPATVDPSDSTKIYNGDTMYYNYGKIISQFPWFGLNGGVGIPGQSGSTFLHFDGTDYYNIASFSYSSNYLHYRITKHAFYRLKAVLQNSSCSLSTVSAESQIKMPNITEVLPNPSHSGFTINSTLAEAGPINICLIDFSGKTIWQTKTGSGSTFVPRNNFPAGLYTVLLQSDSGDRQTCKLVIE